MFYKKSTAAIAAIFVLILLATLFVCAPRPYSNNVWFEACLLVVSGFCFGMMCVRLCEERDSSLPVAIVGVQVTFRWLLFVAVMAFPILLVDHHIKFKYFALIHFIGFGVCAMLVIAPRMSLKSIESQDAEHPIALESRRNCFLKLSRLIDEMKQVGFGSDELLKNLSRLNKDFRYGFGQGDKTESEDIHIAELLDEMRNAFNRRDEVEVGRLVDVLRVEFNNRERIARM